MEYETVNHEIGYFYEPKKKRFTWVDLALYIGTAIIWLGIWYMAWDGILIK